jgi:hypothetical protein
VKYVQHSEGNKTQILRPLDSQKLSWMAHFNKTFMLSYTFNSFVVVASTSEKRTGWFTMKQLSEEEEKPFPSSFKCLSRARICKRLRSSEIDSASLCSLGGRYVKQGCRSGPRGWESIPELLKRFTNSCSEACCRKGGGLTHPPLPPPFFRADPWIFHQKTTLPLALSSVFPSCCMYKVFKMDR